MNEEQKYGEPPQWADGDWWRRPNIIRDVGEVYGLARRESNRIRRHAYEKRAFIARMGL